MEYIDFRKLIDALVAKSKETEWLEFKHNFHSKEEIGERISAISNSAYLSNRPFGYIVFGIDDESHDVVGTNLYGKQKMVGNEDLESWLSTRLNPRIDFEIIDEFDYEDKGQSVSSRFLPQPTDLSAFCMRNISESAQQLGNSRTILPRRPRFGKAMRSLWKRSS